MSLVLDATLGIQFPGDVGPIVGFSPFDNTSAVSDVTLQPGESCYITYTSATSIPLYIACGDGQIYELIITNDSSQTLSPSSTAQLYLNPNNTTYTNAFLDTQLYGESVGGTAAANQNTESSATLGYAPNVFFSRATVSTSTIKKYVHAYAHAEFAGPSRYNENVWSVWNDITTVWSSLGTLSYGVAHTGTATVRRIK